MDRLPPVRCCIAGGGPAGMMLGYLLARAGIETVVLEKHADFLRDFRGDTVHPSTLEVMHELGLLEEFLQRPHQKIQKAKVQIGDQEITLVDFGALRTHCRFIAMMPQWDFLDFVASHAACFPAFHLMMQTEVTGLIEDSGRVTGVRATSPDGPTEIHADLVVGADGRNSVLRDLSGLTVDQFGAPMDVLWMRLPKKPGDPELIFRADRGRILVRLDRGDYWQCAYLIAKGSYQETRRKGIEDLRAGILEIAPFFRDRVDQIRDWDDVKLLTVRVDRLRRWYRPGLLFIGDAAHAMSPVGGVGINLAIQDATAAANLLTEPLRKGVLTVEDLAKVQRRRAFPTRVTQRIQMILQNVMTGRALDKPGPVRLPLPVRILERTKLPRRIRARIIGIGVRPEHVRTAAL